MLISNFPKFSVLSPNFQGGANARFSPAANAHESTPPHLFEKQNVLEKISSDLATLLLTHGREVPCVLCSLRQETTVIAFTDANMYATSMTQPSG